MGQLALTLTPTQWTAILDFLTIAVLFVLNKLGVKAPIERRMDTQDQHLENISASTTNIESEVVNP